MFKKITILGVGLIGASFGLAARQQGICTEVAGYGRSRENLERALRKGAIDSYNDDPAAACEGADLIMLATPVGSFRDLVQRISGKIKGGAIVTDAGSVKGDLVSDLEAMMPEGAYYVGGHPIAGSELSGADAAYAGLFERAKCIITPTPDTAPEALAAVRELWERLGAVVVHMDPQEHDRVYAAVSHLPHLIAFAMVNTVADLDESYLSLAGQGFRDMTRIAGSSPELWRDICIMNRRNMAGMIEVFRKNLDTLSSYLGQEEAGLLEKEFRRARLLRDGIGRN